MLTANMHAVAVRTPAHAGWINWIKKQLSEFLIVITTVDLKSHTKADLAKMAKRFGVSVSGSMRKDDLVAAVAKAAKTSKTSKASKPAGKKTNEPTVKKRPPASQSNATGKSKATVKSKAAPPKATSRASASRASAGGAPAKKSPTAQTKSSAGIKSSANKGTAKGTARTVVATKAKIDKATKVRADAGKTNAAQSHRKKAKPAADSSINKQTASKPAVKNNKQTAKKHAAQKSSRALAGVSSADAKPVLSNGASARSGALAQTPASKASARSKPTPTSTDPLVLQRIREVQLQRQSDKDLTSRPTLIRPPGAIEPILDNEPRKDRIALFVRDAHWMHATWDITRHAIERAKAAMMEHWHGAKPILRLIRMDDTGTTNTSETTERDIEIHGGLRNWYIEWSGEPANFRVLIGYLSSSGRFHAIAKSNIVKTPGAGTPDAVDEHWSDLGAESERIFAVSGGYDGELDSGELREMLEDRLRRSLGAPPLAKLGAGADSPFRQRGGFHFEMEVELVAYGSTVPDGYLTLNGEPVALRSDGTFALRVPFPDRRQVLPAVACSRDGSQQRTIVVAVERNTKIMEPLESEQDTGE